MKEKVVNPNARNLNLQSEVEGLNSQIQQLQLVSQSVDSDASWGNETPMFQFSDDGLQALEKRIASKCSDDGVSDDSIVFNNFTETEKRQ